MKFVKEHTSASYSEVGNVEFEFRKLNFEVRKWACVPVFVEGSQRLLG